MEADDEFLSQATQEAAPPPGSRVYNPQDDGPWGILVPLESHLDSIQLYEEEMVFGRHRNCTVTFHDLRVSKKHCRLFRTATTIITLHDSLSCSQGEEHGQIFIEDLSSNGTWVNKKKLGKGNKTMLCHGDSIDLILTTGESGELVHKISYMFRDLSIDDAKPAIEQDEINQRYDVKQVIGKGNFSEVHLGVNIHTGETVAIKKIDKKKISSHAKANIMREADILKQVAHKNIVQIKDLIDSDRYLYLVLELASGGELYERLAKRGALSENSAKEIFSQILQAVAYLHQQGIVHRDLKPENIMFERKYSNTVKVTDFGLAKLLGSKEMMTTLCGTPMYVAPEIITATRKGVGDRMYMGKQVDVWSLGVLLYIMLSGHAPFEEEHFELKLFEQIELGLFDFPDDTWGHISKQAQDLVSRLLVVDPLKRITVANAILHPWLQSNKENFDLARNSAAANVPLKPRLPIPEDREDSSIQCDSLPSGSPRVRRGVRRVAVSPRKRKRCSEPDSSTPERYADVEEDSTAPTHPREVMPQPEVSEEIDPLEREHAVVLGGPKGGNTANNGIGKQPGPKVKKQRTVRVSGLKRSSSASTSRGGKRGNLGFSLPRQEGPRQGGL